MPPTWNSAAVFSGLLGGNGTYAVTPTELRAVWGGYYEPGSLIWVERWITTGAIIECREALALPSDPHTAVVLRRLRAIQGDAVLMADLWPRADFGRHPMRHLRRRVGCWSARSGALWLRWSGAPLAPRSEDGLRATFRLAPGQHHDLALEISDCAFKDAPPDADRTWQRTEVSWAEVVPPLSPCLNSRNARHATPCSGASAEGSAIPKERLLRRLPRYPGARVRLGNRVGEQFQLDILGEALLLPASRRATPTSDPRVRATLAAVVRDLVRDGYAYRYRPDQCPLGEAEGSFLPCGYFEAQGTHDEGQDVEARGWFERSSAATGPPGLFTEEDDVGERQLRGNLPREFAHALLLEASHTASPRHPQPDRRRRWAGRRSFLGGQARRSSWLRPGSRGRPSPGC